jgi:predicted P-loop ATPase
MMNVGEDPPELFALPANDDDAPDAPNWKSSLVCGDRGPKATLGNAIHALSLSLEWRGVLSFNAFDGSVTKVREPPMRSHERPADYELGEWNDTDSSLACAWLSRVANVSVSPQIAGRAAYAVAQQNRVHPVRDYLSALKWDGTQRLPSWLTTHLGATPSDYVSAVGTRWMISAVARVFDPGCKVDHALVLEGPQGIGKSSALELLAGMKWFSDTPIVFGDKDSYEALRGVWIYELAELSSLRRSDVEAQKAYISKRYDRYRRPYGEGPIVWKRQVVFVGTTNDEHYLIDPTGNRRFWPVRCGKIDLAQLSQDREQLWAEAVARYESKEAWHLDTLDLVQDAAREQEARVHDDDWETLITRWLETDQAKTMLAMGEGLSIVDALVVGLRMKNDSIGRAESTRAGIIFRRLGWTLPRRVTLATGARERRMFPPPAEPSA